MRPDSVTIIYKLLQKNVFNSPCRKDNVSPIRVVEILVCWFRTYKQDGKGQHSKPRSMNGETRNERSRHFTSSSVIVEALQVTPESLDFLHLPNRITLILSSPSHVEKDLNYVLFLA